MRKVGYGNNMTFPQNGVSQVKSLPIFSFYGSVKTQKWAMRSCRSRDWLVYIYLERNNQKLATFLIASNSSGSWSLFWFHQCSIGVFFHSAIDEWLWFYFWWSVKSSIVYLFFDYTAKLWISVMTYILCILFYSQCSSLLVPEIHWLQLTGWSCNLSF